MPRRSTSWWGDFFGREQLPERADDGSPAPDSVHTSWLFSRETLIETDDARSGEPSFLAKLLRRESLPRAETDSGRRADPPSSET